MAKVAYEWMVQSKVIPKRKDNDQSCLQVDRQLKSPTGKRFKVKSSPRGKANDQSHLWVDSPT